MATAKLNNAMTEHVEVEEKGDAVQAGTSTPPADYDIIDRGGEAVLLSIEGDAEAAMTHLKLAKDGHVSRLRSPAPFLLSCLWNSSLIPL